MEPPSTHTGRIGQWVITGSVHTDIITDGELYDGAANIMPINTIARYYISFRSSVTTRNIIFCRY
ncbi:MAG: hypothetical protein LC127_04940 [Chitinophagales bacterium]|nr:hypothetical protein [Chitinophagales bacterium]